MIIFTAFALRPAIQISTVIYYELNINTIIEKYCINKERPQLSCNGKCYLMNQLKVTTNTSDSNKADNFAIITDTFIPLFFQDTDIRINNNYLIVTKKEENWKPNSLQLKDISKKIEYPPENHFS